MEYKKIQLKELIDYANTGADAIQRAPIVEYDTGVRCIRIGDISNNRKYEEWGFTEISKENYNKYKLDVGDILIARTGSTIGICKIIKKEINGVYNNGLIKVKVNKDKCDSNYFYYILQSKDFINYIQGIAFGTTGQPNMKINDFLKFEINDISIEKQNKIANILLKIDEKIDLNNQINDNLHDLAEQQFIKIYNSGNEKTLGDLLDNVSTGSRPKGGAQSTGIPSVGAEKIEKFGVYDYSSEKYISQDFYEKLKNGKMKSGDVLLYKDGAYTGKVSMCLNGFPHKESAVNEHVFILNTKDNWAQNYLYFTIYNKENKEMLERLASSKAAQPGLNQSELRSLKIKICDKETIENFEANVKPIMENIANNSLENKKLVELRDTLLPKLMNGEIDLDKIEI